MRSLGAAKPDEQQPLTQDEFVQTRRRLQPKAESDFIESELAKVRETERWQNESKGLRENLEAAERTNAREAYAAGSSMLAPVPGFFFGFFPLPGFAGGSTFSGRTYSGQHSAGPQGCGSGLAHRPEHWGAK
jgi:hypothetical protein